MKAVIFAGGTLGDPEYYREMLRDADAVICADGGCRHAEALGLVPDVVIGDFDSYPAEKALARREKIVLPKEKDQTDSHACVCYAVEHGFDEILLLGAIGTRMDHTIANLHLLKIAADAGASMRIADECNEIFLARNETVIPKKEGWHVSLLPIGRAEGIDSEGLYYPLCDGKMEFGNPYGVSNEFAGDTARVRVKSGMLLVILSKG